MKSILFSMIALGTLIFMIMSCSKEKVATTSKSITSEIKPVDINKKGFELLEKMQGHWVGHNKVMSWEWDWFAFDYRPISPSHIFGIYESGSIGNLFTSFFITDFKDTRTIMARNGGILSGIYRTSYFVLDKVRSEDGEDYYRFVDAVGGENTMYMELKFSGDSLNWNAYTSRLGENTMPTRHFSFKAKKEHLQLATAAATKVNFPLNISTWDFSDGFKEKFLYVIPNEKQAKSASFLAQASGSDVFTLAIESGDPFKIQDHPYLATLQVDVERNTNIKDNKLLLYLSFEPLTDENGIMNFEAFDSVLLFPDIPASQNEFLFTYLHPGDYYITVIADHNNDSQPSEGDITHVSQPITINPDGKHQISIKNINIKN